jgi:hypothetical protein
MWYVSNLQLRSFVQSVFWFLSSKKEDASLCVDSSMNFSKKFNVV